jgi:hypothetical protein
MTVEERLDRLERLVVYLGEMVVAQAREIDRLLSGPSWNVSDDAAASLGVKAGRYVPVSR